MKLENNFSNMYYVALGEENIIIGVFLNPFRKINVLILHQKTNIKNLGTIY